MKTFIEYIRESTEETETKESLFAKIINISLDKYPDEVSDFLSVISSKDPAISDIVEKIKNINLKFKDEDVVSSNLPDNNFGNEEV